MNVSKPAIRMLFDFFSHTLNSVFWENSVDHAQLMNGPGGGPPGRDDVFEELGTAFIGQPIAVFQPFGQGVGIKSGHGPGGDRSALFAARWRIRRGPVGHQKVGRESIQKSIEPMNVCWAGAAISQNQQCRFSVFPRHFEDFEHVTARTCKGRRL